MSSKYRYTEPIQMPRGSHYGSSYILMPSKKVGRTVTLYSNLEYANALTLEMNPEVEYYCEQPDRVKTIIDDSFKETTFDVWVLYKNGKEEFQEVKYSTDLKEKTAKGNNCRRQIAAQKLWCSDNNFEYSIRTEKEIMLGNYYIRNLTYLAGKVRRIPTLNPDIIKFVKAYHDTIDGITIGRLDSMGIFEKNHTMDYLSFLCYEGLITFRNIADELITNKTEVIYCGKP